MRTDTKHYIAVAEGMEKRAFDPRDILGPMGELLLLGVGLPVGAGIGAAHIASNMSSPGTGKGAYGKLRDTEMLTVLNRLTEQAEQRARQLRGEQD